MTPIILFNDKNLSRTDIDVLSLIISLTFKYGYCYACNERLAKYVNTSKRTISDSLSKLRKLNYIKVNNEDNRRKIYLNNEKIPTKIANDVATNSENVTKNRSSDITKSCNHNINNKYKSKYMNNYNYINSQKNSNVPEWMENPMPCELNKTTLEEQQEMKELIKEIIGE